MINCCVKETTKIIIKELGEYYFAILADESFDVSHKEQMSLCLRHVDKKGAMWRDFLIGDMSSTTDNDKLKAKGVSFAIESFEFVFMAHLMKIMFGMVNELNIALQKQDQDILQELNTRFDEISTSLLICMASLSPVDAFCSFDKQKLHKLVEFYPKEFSSVELLALNSQLETYIHDMRKDERFIGFKNIGELSVKLVELNKHESFDLVDLLIKLVLIFPVATASVERVFSGMNFVKNKLRNSIGENVKLQELNTRFDEISTSLLICMASLSPVDAFCSFDKQKLLKLVEFYPKEFSSGGELLALNSQLETYIHDMRKDERFIGFKNIGELSVKLVELNKHESFDLVDLLIKLVLIFPVATASVERVFSCMNFVKNKLRNSIVQSDVGVVQDESSSVVGSDESDVAVRVELDKLTSKIA
ncbi:zinc finger MYM-type protein 1-like protein [Tanacetum coccineum]